MSFPGLATNYCLENRLNHMCIMECSSDHKISHSSKFRLTLKCNSTCYMTECSLYSYQTQVFDKKKCSFLALLSG